MARRQCMETWWWFRWMEIVMPNAYINNAHNCPPAFTKMTVGQKCKTLYGIGTIVDLKSAFHRGQGSNTDPWIATIIVPGNPVIVIYQTYSTIIFTDSAVGGEVTNQGQYNSLL
jgi:hypothetical protein